MILALSACSARTTTTVPEAGDEAKVRAPQRTATLPGGADLTAKAKGELVAKTKLTGKVKLDGGFILANSAGVLANSGANLVVAGSLLADGGAGLLSNNGSTLIAKTRLIASDAALIAKTRLTPAQAELLANNGGSLIAKTRYQALQAGAPGLGALVSVQGLPLAAFSLKTSERLSDPVLTDADGAFELAVPAGLAENIRIVAKVPLIQPEGGAAELPRLVYNVLVAPAQLAEAAAPVELDEDTALVTDFMRAVFVARIEALLRTGDTELGKLPLPAEMVTALRAQRLYTLPAAEQAALAQRLTDGLLAFYDLENTQVEGTADAILPTMRAIWREIREKAGAKMAERPAFFAEQAYMRDANAARAGLGLPPLVIEKPADLVAFIVTEYLIAAEGELPTGSTKSDRREAMAKTEAALATIGVPGDRVTRLKAVVDTIVAQFQLTMLSDPAAMAFLVDALTVRK